jgi:all-trans-8'-apo-beta-carotenal 15,15'-oxygenase
VVKVDAAEGHTLHRDFFPHLTGEPRFVPRPGGSAEDDGWLLTLLYDVETSVTRLLVLDAETLEMEAALTLPHALPLGFHGQFVPGRPEALARRTAQ